MLVKMALTSLIEREVFLFYIDSSLAVMVNRGKDLISIGNCPNIILPISLIDPHMTRIMKKNASIRPHSCKYA